MKRFLVFALVITIVLASGVVAFAGTSTTSPTSGIISESTVSVDDNDPKTWENIQNGGIPEVSVDKASDYVQSKGYDIVRFLQKVIQPLAVVIFIVCAILTLIGALGNSQLTGKGIWGMIIAAIMYIAIIYSPEILSFIVNWAGSTNNAVTVPTASATVSATTSTIIVS